jgi:AMP-binding enzyme
MYLADLEDALAVFGPRLAQIYGLGETPMTITALSEADHADRNHPRWRDRLRSVGVPRTNLEIGVVDEADRNLPAGEAGEVVVRGDVVMAGYWKQPDATAEAVRDGWLHAGDVGSFAADGYLTLRDRSKEDFDRTCLDHIARFHRPGAGLSAAIRAKRRKTGRAETRSRGTSNETTVRVLVGSAKAGRSRDSGVCRSTSALAISTQ